MSSQPWRLIRSGVATGPFNMALDQVLLEEVAAGRSQPVLRVYRWEPATVSLGYAQRGKQAVNLAACRELGLQVVRRPTGGRAVLHDREMTYAVVAPERGDPFPGGIVANYGVISGVLQATLQEFGLVTELAVGPPVSDGAAALKSACFTAPVTTELLYRGHKLAGGAQKRQQGAFLQHGSVPVEVDLHRLFRALNADQRLTAEEGTTLLAARVGWLNRWLAAAVAVEQLEEAFIRLFARRLGIELQPGKPTGKELAAAEALARTRFADLCRGHEDLPVDSPGRRHYV